MTKSILGGCAILLGLGVAACTADRRQTEAQVSSALSVAPATMARVGRSTIAISRTTSRCWR